MGAGGEEKDTGERETDTCPGSVFSSFPSARASALCAACVFVVVLVLPLVPTYTLLLILYYFYFPLYGLCVSMSVIVVSTTTYIDFYFSTFKLLARGRVRYVQPYACV